MLSQPMQGMAGDRVGVVYKKLWDCLLVG